MKMRHVGWSALHLLLVLLNDHLINGAATNSTAAAPHVSEDGPRLQADWAAHLTESPVAAATLDHNALHNQTRVSNVTTKQSEKVVPQTPLANTSPSPINSVRPRVTVSTEQTPKQKNIELITRRPTGGDATEDKDKRKRRKKGQKSRPTEPPQNDGPHQDTHTTWAHLPDRHQQKWGLDEKAPQNDFAPWGYRIHIQEPQQPDFQKARPIWAKYWPVHVYSTGGLFAFLSVVNLWQLITKIFTPASALLITKGRFVCVTIFLLTATSLRATFLLVDPYNADGTYPTESLPTLVDLPLLCIATSFAIVFLSLLNITCVRLTSKNLQNNCVLAFIIVLVCGVAISCDIIAGLYPSRATIRLISFAILTSWTTIMVLCFFYVFKDVNRAARRKHGESLRATFTKLHMEGADLPHKLPRPTICVAVRVSLINALLLLALNGGIIYGLLVIGRVFEEDRRPADPWPWWSQQLVLRMLELTLCVLLGYTASQGQCENDNRSEDSAPEVKEPSCLRRLFTFNCCRCCCKRNDEVHNYESCSDIAYGFRNENFNTSLDFSNVPTAATTRSHAWSRGQTTAPLTFQGRSEESGANSARSHPRNSLLAHPIQALSSLGSGRQSRFATNSTVESSQRHSTILFRDKLRRGAVPTTPVTEAPPTEEDDGDDESIRARMGSRVHSITEEDAMLLSSPFFPRFKRSHCSSLDNSIDVSSDQLSSLGQSGHGVEYVAHHHRRTIAGSTCSSESAANSFDVAFFLNSNPYLNHSQAVAAQREFMERLVRHEQERHMKRTTQEDRRRFLEEYERIQEEMQRGRIPVDPGLRSISPIVSARASSNTAGPRQRGDSSQSDGQICDTDAPRNLDRKEWAGRPQTQANHNQPGFRSEVQTQQHLQHSPQHQNHHQHQPQQHHPPASAHKMSLDLAPSGVVGSLYPAQQHSQHNREIGPGLRCNTTTVAADEDITPDSAVYLDLHMSPSDDSRDLHTIHNSFNSLKRASRSFLSRINSTFSLSNKSYAPLESADECVTYFGGSGTMDKIDRRQRLRAARSADALAAGRCEHGGIDDVDSEHENEHGLQHGDSGLLVEENSQRSSVLCDSACQTEPLCT